VEGTTRGCKGEENEKDGNKLLEEGTYIIYLNEYVEFFHLIQKLQYMTLKLLVGSKIPQRAPGRD
jgi:hypothetical protein